MKAAINTSPLIFLAKLGRLDLLDGIELLIPRQVYDEIGAGRSSGKNDCELISGWLKKTRVKVIDVGIPASLSHLGRGEASAISLASKQGLGYVLLDDRKARAQARIMGMTSKGTIAVIIDAAREKKISRQEAKAAILELLRAGFRIREEFLLEILYLLEKL